MLIINACGLSCPQPVLLALNAIKNNEHCFEILVDNNVACENIKRLANTKNYDINFDDNNDKLDKKIKIILTKKI